MLYRLCLQALGEEATEGFSEAVGRLLGLKVTKGAVEDWNYDGDTVAHYRCNQLGRPRGAGACRVTVVEGVLLHQTKLYTLRDIHLSYSKGQSRAALTLLKKLLAGPWQLILAAPELEARVDGLLGKRLALPTGKENLQELGTLYLPWQVYSISMGWAQLLANPRDRLLVRQQRVKLRRLRSCFVFFKGGLPKDLVLQWQLHLKNTANTLSKLRELDVALLTCERMRRQLPGSGESPEAAAPDRLEQLFANLREIETTTFFAEQSLNRHTLMCAEFLLRVQLGMARNIKGKGYLNRRLETWIENLQGLTEKYPDFYNMEDLHKIRIKVKRFRYVLQTITLLKVDAGLVRRLKRLQDMLGFLHDDYVNAEWAKLVVDRHPGDHSLNYRASEFLGWERAKAQAALDQLPELWQDFLEAIEAWQKAKGKRN